MEHTKPCINMPQEQQGLLFNSLFLGEGRMIKWPVLKSPPVTPTITQVKAGLSSTCLDSRALSSSLTEERKVFEAAETGNGEALKKSVSNLMTFFNIRQDTLSAMCSLEANKANLFGFSHFNFRTLLLVGKPLSQLVGLSSSKVE